MLFIFSSEVVVSSIDHIGAKSVIIIINNFISWHAQSEADKLMARDSASPLFKSM